jgi:DNA-directed RNA polymerase beta subunit
LAQSVTAPRARKSFSRLKHVLDLPNLIDIQRESFDWFLREGLRETIDDISPIEDYYRLARSRFRRLRVRPAPVLHPGVPRRTTTYQARSR